MSKALEVLAKEICDLQNTLSVLQDDFDRHDANGAGKQVKLMQEITAVSMELECSLKLYNSLLDDAASKNVKMQNAIVALKLGQITWFQFLEIMRIPDFTCGTLC